MPTFGDKLIVTLQQRGTIKKAFNALDGTIENMTTTVVVFDCNPNLYFQIAAE
jgi:hypothetical protein